MIKFKKCKCQVERGNFKINEIPLDCPAVWELLATGNTIGIFQLEKSLGQDWARKTRAKNIEELAALTALLRPGPLESSMTQDYVDIKFKRKKNTYIHPALKLILDPTYGCMVYQEQAIKIATDLAGLSPESADELRKAIGKKDPKLMAKIKEKFINGSKTHKNIDEEIAEEIFGWIEKCQRYSFNKCVSGETVIRRPNGGKHIKGSEYTVEHMYRVKNDIVYAKQCGHESLRRKWKTSGNYGKGLSMCADGMVRQNTVQDIQPAGRKRVFKVTLANGSTISVTSNHKFPTPNGEKTLAELSVGDSLYICGIVGRGEKGYPAQTVKIESIVTDGVVDTWDVTMTGPNHNLVVNDDIITCNSHAVSYGLIAYQTAWAKCHFPKEFFTSYLTFSGYKTDPKDEIYRLVQDARLFGVSVLQPDIRRGNVNFKVVDGVKNSIAFGLSHIRGVGASAIEKIIESQQSIVTWNDFLASVPDFHRNVGIALIKSGACDCFGMGRSEMVRELEAILGTQTVDSLGKKVEIKGLTAKEREYFFDKLKEDGNTSKEVLSQMSHPPSKKTKTTKQMLKTELLEASRNYLGQAMEAFDKIVDGDGDFVYTSQDEKEMWLDSLKGRKKAELQKLLIDNGYKDVVTKPPCASDARRRAMSDKVELLSSEIRDTNLANATAEKHFLGISLSCSPADDMDRDISTHTCLEVARSPNDESIIVCVIIDSVKHTKTKRGKNPGQPMCFLTVSDATYSIDHAVVFPGEFETLRGLCKEDIICLLYGEKKNGSFIVKNIQKLM